MGNTAVNTAIRSTILTANTEVNTARLARTTPMLQALRKYIIRRPAPAAKKSTRGNGRLCQASDKFSPLSTQWQTRELGKVKTEISDIDAKIKLKMLLGNQKAGHFTP